MARRIISRWWRCEAVVGLVGLLLLTASPVAAYMRPGATHLFGACVKQCASESRFEPDNASVSFDATGRFVAFSNYLPVEGAPQNIQGLPDAFVWDRAREKTDLVSVSTAGSRPLYLPGGGGSLNPHISASGRYVAFSSDALNLVMGDTNLARDIFVHDRKTGRTDRVSVASSGDEGNGASESAAISGNGRYVAFLSTASNLVENDSNGVIDAFVHDRKTNKTERVSVASDGSEARATDQGQERGARGNPSISFTGRYVAFGSWADNLAEGDTNGGMDVFVRDRKTKKTELVSKSSHGEQANFGSGTFWVGPHGISANGRFIVFTSGSGNLVPNDTNPSILVIVTAVDVFVHDRKSGRTERVSVSSAGEEATGNSGVRTTALTPSGRHIIFSSAANNLTPGDTGGSGIPSQPGDFDVFVHDSLTGATERISVDSKGREATECFQDFSCGAARGLSGDGRVAVFETTSRLDPNDQKDDDTWTLYLRDRGTARGVGGLLFGSQGVAPSESAPTGVATIADVAGDTLGLAGDGSDLLSATLAHRPDRNDLYVKIDVDHMPGPRGTGLAGNPAIVYGLKLTADGVAYEVRIAKSRVLGGTAKPAFGLFRCDPECSRVTDLKGGYGTVGESVVAALPLETLGLKGGGRIEDVIAYSAYGAYDVGVTTVLDKAALR